MSPIPDETIDRNRYLMLYDDEPIMNAVVALRDAENGQDWWHLVVDLEGGGYAVARFSDVAQYVADAGPEALQTPLGDLVGQIFMPVQVVVEQQEADLEASREEAYDSASQIIVILQQGALRGVLPVGGTRGGLFDRGLVDLAGQNAHIPQEGIMSRRRKQAARSESSKPRDGEGASTSLSQGENQ